ncbi:MAG TPA: carboxypeptidase-like regulatory domain-containing protein, partial [Gemmatimonadales bacterium]
MRASHQPSAISRRAFASFASFTSFASFATFASFPSSLAAQQVDLQIREEGSRAPVAGAIVRLLGDRGVAAQGLTSEQGRIVLRAPTPGSYRIKVDRIGWSG